MKVEQCACSHGDSLLQIYQILKLYGRLFWVHWAISLQPLCFMAFLNDFFFYFMVDWEEKAQAQLKRMYGYVDILALHVGQFADGPFVAAQVAQHLRWQTFPQPGKVHTTNSELLLVCIKSLHMQHSYSASIVALMEGYRGATRSAKACNISGLALLSSHS